ncbi:SusC/RagA family TonB-linked outer membrane protein [Xanthocytophaga flava]|uniref:SusC/RagA family TonB-linked outer membrane protein n=1 Tax=Xanthocytophaga flava TaxID=3048013 RepID=UPI0028D86145|nr:TonB-dependent receptor [Xanthocytophaga flavus]MDJ1467902.1 TonB-dependent receptor [Xanthocytophaga flavus]
MKKHLHFKSLLFLLLFLSLAMPSQLFGQSEVTVSGKVTSASNGETLPGVSILVEGTTTGTVTDVNGVYTLKAGANAQLIFTFVGYVQEKIAVNNQTTIDVALVPDIQTLGEVVVVGYGTQSRKNLTSAITNVKPEELNRGAITDVGQLLQGKVPGLNITASGDPNRTAAVILRGASTLNSSQSPLYVIDGVIGADISIIAPDDIASIDVLKDGSATAIYGNRAANGVIMVTTKKGKKGQMQVGYNGYIGMEKVSNQLDLMNGNQLRTFWQKNSIPVPSDDEGANTNWQSAIQKSSAFSTNHNLSFSGGTEHSSYNASINYARKEGILLKSAQERVIARLNIEHSALNDKVKFGLNVSNSNTKASNTPMRNVVLQQVVKYLPVSPIRNADGSFYENFDKPGAYYNPVAMIEHGQDDTKTNALVAAFTTHVNLPLGLTYDLNVSYQNTTYLHGEFYDSYYSKNYNATFYSNPEPPGVRQPVTFGTNGFALRSSYQDTRKVVESFVTWAKQFGSHDINLVLGYSWQDNEFGDGIQATTTNLPVDNIGYNNFALSNPYAVSSFRIGFGSDEVYQHYRMISDFARLNYSFKDKYLLQGSIRRDGSSVFGANNRWGYFPSIGVAWRIADEAFMKSQSFVNDLKLRASYGVTGNASGFNPYTAQFISGSLGTFYYNGVQLGAYGPTQLSNPDLKWEKTATANIGLDFTILSGKLSGTVEVYDKKTTGMITTYAVDPARGPSGQIVANGGSMDNRGIEVSLSATPVKANNGFTWNTSINFAHNTNKILSLTNPLFTGGDSTRITQPDGGGQTGSTLQILKSGKPLGEFFSLQYAGKDSAGTSQYINREGIASTSPAIGRDYHYLGSPQPKLLVGWSNTLTYKNFDLNLFFRGSFGGKIFNATRAELFRLETATSANILNDAANEPVSDRNVYKYSSRFIESGTYVRLDNATLGYSFKNLGQSIRSLRVYTSVNNAFIITKYTGVDPEINQGGTAPGVDSNNFYPKTRTFLLGVNLSF